MGSSFCMPILCPASEFFLYGRQQAGPVFFRRRPEGFSALQENFLRLMRLFCLRRYAWLSVCRAYRNCPGRREAGYLRRAVCRTDFPGRGVFFQRTLFLSEESGKTILCYLSEKFSDRQRIFSCPGCSAGQPFFFLCFGCSHRHSYI